MPFFFAPRQCLLLLLLWAASPGRLLLLQQLLLLLLLQDVRDYLAVTPVQTGSTTGCADCDNSRVRAMDTSHTLFILLVVLVL